MRTWDSADLRVSFFVTRISISGVLVLLADTNVVDFPVSMARILSSG